MRISDWSSDVCSSDLGLGWAEWPARMQKLESGPLCDLLPPGSSLWLDGGHNPAAARVIADTLRELAHGANPVLLVLGILANKDVAGFLTTLAGLLTAVYSVPSPNHAHHSPGGFFPIANPHNTSPQPT